jgi:hypothetical protein
MDILEAIGEARNKAREDGSNCFDQGDPSKTSYYSGKEAGLNLAMTIITEYEDDIVEAEVVPDN